MVAIYNSFNIRGTHIAFNLNIVRYTVNQCTTLVNDWMESEIIAFFESFTNGVNPHNTHQSSIKSIDAFMRCLSRMSHLAVILNQFRYKTIRGTTKPHFTSWSFGSLHMHLHSHIDIIESTFIDKLLLPTHIFQFSLLTQFVAVINFNHFLCRDSK